SLLRVRARREPLSLVPPPRPRHEAAHRPTGRASPPARLAAVDGVDGRRPGASRARTERADLPCPDPAGKYLEGHHEGGAMSLSTGSRIGSYEILAPLGAGGMGEVFRARDTKLNRDVAIKVLPAAFAEDRERVARFRREAQVLASLNHPNVAAIHGL